MYNNNSVVQYIHGKNIMYSGARSVDTKEFNITGKNKCKYKPIETDGK